MADLPESSGLDAEFATTFEMYVGMCDTQVVTEAQVGSLRAYYAAVVAFTTQERDTTSGNAFPPFEPSVGNECLPVGWTFRCTRQQVFLLAQPQSSPQLLFPSPSTLLAVALTSARLRFSRSRLTATTRARSLQIARSTRASPRATARAAT